MTRVHIILLVVAGISYFESIWGLLKPQEIKNTLSRYLPDVPSRQPGMGVFLIVMALGLWLAVPDNFALSSWLLLAVVILLTMLGVCCFKKDAFAWLVEVCIVNRSIRAVWLIYFAEFLFAGLLTWTALTGR